MKLKKLVAPWIGAAVALGCSNKAETPEAATPNTDGMPARIDVCLTGAYVALVKPDGTTWHPGPSPSEDNIKALKNLVSGLIEGATAKVVPGAKAAGSLTTLLGPSVLVALAKPHVYGTATLLPRGSEEGSTTLPVRSREQPAKGWIVGFSEGTNDGTCFQSVDWSPEIKIRIHLRDQHLLEWNDQDIATVYLKSPDLAAAYRLGEVAAVPMLAQSNSALLFVSVDVRKR